MSKTAVVILNWNGRALLEKFLPIVVKHSNIPDVDVIVADNASTDESVNFLNEHYPMIRIIELDKNYGFAGGYNKALQELDADYYVLLNSDVAPETNWLAPLIKAMEENDKLGACMPKIRAYHVPQSFEYAGASGGFIDIFGYPFCRGRILDSIEEDNEQYNEPMSVFWASGAALMINAQLYKKSGGLDASFFAHMEEIDLCWRIRNMGYDIQVIPSSEVLHVGGATLSQQSSHKTYLNFRNNLLMLVKNLPGNIVLPIVFMRMVLDGVAGLHFILKGELKFFTAVLKAHFSFYARLPKVISQRKLTAEWRPKGKHKEIYPRSIIWDYYIKGIRRFSQLRHF
ncbi:glycosyltransferase family 2 protein [Carboxylicivirga sp. M1479]|uniref:glycosyltransferase family 2 protein n=1 Tax=Carboxylicivirga sp. M1479 TaxID=2594476 RepID=UPI0011778D87|nr:glycosyltransferase family 2 protein [Carboxylicivirga sp. M1479]TRX65772.1 glycosyltransferase family 2 protein [Carboxylicivirga sp. M1479]